MNMRGQEIKAVIDVQIVVNFKLVWQRQVMAAVYGLLVRIVNIVSMSIEIDN